MKKSKEKTEEKAEEQIDRKAEEKAEGIAKDIAEETAEEKIEDEEIEEDTTSDSQNSAGETQSDVSDLPEPPSPMLVKILSLAMAILEGKTTDADLAALMNAADARAAVEAARAEGEIAGRNAAIEESLASTEEIIAPDLRGTPAPASRRRPDSIFDLAYQAR